MFGGEQVCLGLRRVVGYNGVFGGVKGCMEV